MGNREARDRGVVIGRWQFTGTQAGRGGGPKGRRNGRFKHTLAIADDQIIFYVTGRKPYAI